MKPKQIFLLVVPCYVMAVGIFYAAAIILGLPFLNSKPPGSYYLTGISIFFFIAGGFFLIQALRGNLKRKGGTIIDVRIEAVQKLNSIELLTQIAENDPVLKVREKAKERLQEIA